MEILTGWKLSSTIRSSKSLTSQSKKRTPSWCLSLRNSKLCHQLSNLTAAQTCPTRPCRTPTLTPATSSASTLERIEELIRKDYSLASTRRTQRHAPKSWLSSQNDPLSPYGILMILTILTRQTPATMTLATLFKKARRMTRT